MAENPLSSPRYQVKEFKALIGLIAAMPLIGWFLFTQTNSKQFWMYMGGFAFLAALITLQMFQMRKALRALKARLAGTACPFCKRAFGERTCEGFRRDGMEYTPLMCLSCGGLSRVDPETDALSPLRPGG